MKPVLRIAKAELFGRHAYYSLDLNSLQFKKWAQDPSPAIYPSGSVRFFFFRPLVLLHEEKTHFLWFPGLEEPIRISHFKIHVRKRLGIFKVLSLGIGSEKRTYWQLDWSGLSEQIDPLYDSFEKEMEDFIYEVEVLHGRQLRRDREQEADLGFIP
jgi:hypothetical protein